MLLFINFAKKNFGIVLILICATFLLLKSLDNQPLWDDEAVTALFARNVQHFGLPLSWDGRNLITGVNGSDFNKDLVQTWDPPLPAYIIAGSFYFLGESTFSARLPFIILAVGAIGLFYILSMMLTNNNKPISLYACLLLLFCAPFLLHMKQARYHALVAFFAQLIFISYLKLKDSKNYVYLFSFSMVMLFYSNLMGFAAISLGLLVFYILFDRKDIPLKSVITGGILIAALTLPWFIYTSAMSNRGAVVSPVILNHLGRMIDYISKFNTIAFPLVLLIPLGYYISHHKSDCSRRALRFVLIISLLSIIIITHFFFAGVRYGLFIIPLLCLGASLIVSGIIKKNKLLGIMVAILLLFTSFFHTLPVLALDSFLAISKIKLSRYSQFISVLTKKDLNKVESFLSSIDNDVSNMSLGNFFRRFVIKRTLFAYFYEISHTYRDPNLGLADFFKENAKKDDKVLINTGQYSLLFYEPDLIMAYVMSKKVDGLPNYTYSYEDTDWYVPRDQYKLKGPYLNDKDFKEYVLGKGWQLKPYEIDYLISNWDGPRVEYLDEYERKHGFGTLDSKKVVIYKIIR